MEQGSPRPHAFRQRADTRRAEWRFLESPCGLRADSEPKSCSRGTDFQAGQTMAQLTYPAPNVTGAVTNCDNWVSSENASVPWREDNVRVDFKLTNTLSIMGRYTNDSWSNPFPSTLGYWGDDIYPSVEGNWTQPGRQATIKLTKLFGGT